MHLQITRISLTLGAGCRGEMHSRMWVEFIRPACGSASPQKYARDPECVSASNMLLCVGCNTFFFFFFLRVLQACYGILKVPRGNWLCRTCALGVQPKCLLCPKRGGALKPTRSGTKWVHVSCALWIPEVRLRNREKAKTRSACVSQQLLTSRDEPPDGALSPAHL